MDTIHLTSGVTFTAWVSNQMKLPHGNFAYATYEGVTYCVREVGYHEWIQLEDPFEEQEAASNTETEK